MTPDVDHVAPHIHEVDAFLWFADNGLSPYWAVGNLLINEFDGHGETTVEIGDDDWHISLAYSKSGIAPRQSDPVESEVLYDYELHLEGPHESKAHYQIRARFDDMRGPDGDQRSIPWRGGEGIDIHTQSSNIPIDALPRLLRRGLDEIAAGAGTSLNPSYFRRVLPDSSISTCELYVRLRRSYAKKLVRTDGVMYRLMHLLANKEGTQWTYSADNEDIVGKRHAMDLDPTSAAEIGPDHTSGIRLKCYHPKHVRSEESDDDPLSSPKFCVAFHRSIDGEARDWRDREDLQRELEETLINVLRWADIPAEPDPTCFVEDDHFKVTASDREIADLADPTPALEAEQESMLLSVLGELTPTAREATKALATDGGMHYQELADETGASVSTIYRVLDQLGDAVESDHGHLKFTSEKIRQEIVGLVDRLDEIVGSTAERVAQLANIDLRSRAGSALEKWMARYGVEFVNDGDGEATVRIDTVLSNIKSTSNPTREEVLEEGIEAWTNSGRDPQDFLRLDFVVAEMEGHGYRGSSLDSGKIGAVLNR